MDNLRIWWQGLVPREQQLVSIAGGFLAVAVLYWGIWSPISQAQQDAERNHSAAVKTLNFVKQSANKLVGLQQTGATQKSAGSLSAIVNQSASQFGLEITRMQPQGDKVQLWMDDVPFDALLSYLHHLVNDQGLILDSLDLAEADVAGLVKVRRIQLSQ